MTRVHGRSDDMLIIRKAGLRGNQRIPATAAVCLVAKAIERAHGPQP